MSRIKELRENKNKSQESIARMLHISLKYYREVEMGKSLPNVVIALNLAKILEVDPYTLFEEQINEYAAYKNEEYNF